ncbi:hypothetical protein C1645_787555 [Glomus cerebriforme]|uniref:MARVEL domain-containing protein n=1 Tax=Glomus cerebriforme TaxID=658196 RepID=A0A397S8D5_9GLOM|nr:hypothetical protein C1645_788074 [Glomus cerebriforme]RIA82862.1 hypothetical protein C1645_787555 [Glomus cerebriforme]
MTKCCCCIPLKIGVIIISSLWLAGGVYQTTNGIINIISPDRTDEPNRVGNIRGPIIAAIVLYGLVTIGAAFGLFVVLFANTPKMLSIYSKIAYCIAAIYIISNLVEVIAIVLSKSKFLEDCKVYSNSSTESQAEKDSACLSMYNSIFKYIIIVAVIAILLVLYYTTIISAYARERKANEDAKHDQNHQPHT